MQAGLFSAVTSAFIIDIQSQLQPDTGEETAALLRLLIYKIDDTAFGNDVPTLPQWTGPPHTIVQVQAILYASLAASLFSAFLAILGKQWLSRYVSPDMQGSIIERCQNRQRKFDGIANWYFDCVIGLLPLMLQAALLLLSGALCRYLWEIDTTIASVVLGVTSFGVGFYFVTVVSGAYFTSCPYQSPGSRALRSIVSVVASTTTAVASTFERTIGRSKILRMLWMKAPWSEPWWSEGNVISGRGLDQQTIHLDFRCISWMLKTSLDKSVRLSTLEPLASMVALADFDPTLVADCLDIFIGCVKAANNTVVVTQGSEQLATASATCLLRTFSHLSVMDPKSRVLGDVRRRYDVTFPPDTDFRGFPFCHTLGAIHSAFYPDWNHPWLDWEDYKPSSHEHDVFAHALANLARSEYQRRGRDKKVPGWILRFVLHSLSLDPPPPTSVVVDCLSIIAIDLGCIVSTTGTTISDKRYVHV